MRKALISRSAISGAWGVCALACAAVSAAAELPPADKAQVLEKARASYYNAKKAGLSEFSCGIVPNLEKIYAEMRKTDPKEAERRQQAFQRMHFRLTVTAAGSVNITHSYDGEAPRDLEQNIELFSKYLALATNGFFGAWKSYMLNPTVLDDFAANIVEKDQARYRIRYKGKNTEWLILLDQDMAITSSGFLTREFKTTIRPRFEKTADGFVLTGYDTSLQEPPDAPNAVEQHIEVVNQQVDGLLIPKTLTIQRTDGDSHPAIELALTGCRVTRGGAPALAVK